MADARNPVVREYTKQNTREYMKEYTSDLIDVSLSGAWKQPSESGPGVPRLVSCRGLDRQSEPGALVRGLESYARLKVVWCSLE